LEGDKVIIQQEHRDKAKLIITELLKQQYLIDNWGKYVLSIGGESGTGKTEIAQVLRSLAYKRGWGAVIVSLDDYYKTNWQDRNKIRRETNLIGITEIDWERLDYTINQFKDNEDTGIIYRLNKYTNSQEQIIYKPKDVNIMIIEGLYANETGDLKVKIKGIYKDTVEFRKLRGKETQNDWRNVVLDREQQDIDNIQYDMEV